MKNSLKITVPYAISNPTWAVSMSGQAPGYGAESLETPSLKQLGFAAFGPRFVLGVSFDCTNQQSASAKGVGI
jgi:hypothetical protein